MWGSKDHLFEKTKNLGVRQGKGNKNIRVK